MQLRRKKKREEEKDKFSFWIYFLAHSKKEKFPFEEWKVLSFSLKRRERKLVEITDLPSRLIDAEPTKSIDDLRAGSTQRVYTVARTPDENTRKSELPADSAAKYVCETRPCM